MNTDNWWSGLYDDLLAEFLLENRSEEDKERSSQFIIDKLRLENDSLVLDQCCGTGSLSLHLAKKGYAVIGMDQAEQYITAAEKVAKKHGLKTGFHTADAFEYVSDRACDGVFNWWTSFGYTLDDSQNKRMLQRAADSLKPEGRFLLDTMNVSGVLRNFKPEVVNESNGKVLIRKTRVDWLTGAMLKEWIYELPDGRRKVHNTSVKLYFPHTIVEMMADCGFEDFELFGDESGNPLEDDSLRCIILARKGK